MGTVELVYKVQSKPAPGVMRVVEAHHSITRLVDFLLGDEEQLIDLLANFTTFANGMDVSRGPTSTEGILAIIGDVARRRGCDNQTCFDGILRKRSLKSNGSLITDINSVEVRELIVFVDSPRE